MKGNKKKGKEEIAALTVVGLMAGTLFLLWFFTQDLALDKSRQERDLTMSHLLPGGGPFTEEVYDGDDQRITALYRSDAGYVVETVVEGYGGDIVLWTGVANNGKVTGLMVRDLNETTGLGYEAARDEAFLRQFIGTSGQASLDTTVDGLTGATVTSRTVVRGVNAAVAFVSGADVVTAPTKWGE